MHLSTSDLRIRAPPSAALEQIMDRHSQKMVWIQQAGRWCDDPVAIHIRVVAKSDLKIILQTDQTCHRIGRGTIHANLAIMIHGHEGEGWVNRTIHNRNVQLVNFGDEFPHVYSRTAHWVHTDT
jgi:hypothetical protein